MAVTADAARRHCVAFPSSRIISLNYREMWREDVMTLTISPPAVATTAVPDLRRHLRFSCAAEADATTVDGRRHLMGTVSELSRCGCYLDTPDAFDVGARMRLQIHHDGRSCDLPARVIYVHKGWGMGVVFDGATAGQLAALDQWLVQLCRNSLTRIES
jgi:PilZ domain